MRILIPNVDGRLTVICPAYDSGYDVESPHLSLDDALVLVQIMKEAEKIGLKIDVLPSSVSLRESAPGLICIGGPISNPISRNLLKRMCPGFTFDTSHQELPGEAEYRFGNREFSATRDQSLWVMAWLPGSITNREDLTLIIFGNFGFDSPSAGYYLAKHARQIARQYKARKGALMLVGCTDPSLGYRTLPSSVFDVSDGAFSSTRTAV